MWPMPMLIDKDPTVGDCHHGPFCLNLASLAASFSFQQIHMNDITYLDKHNYFIKTRVQT